VKARVEDARRENPDVPVPADLVTTSASGLDPDLSPAAALFQVPRVARARRAAAAHAPPPVLTPVHGRQLGVLRRPPLHVLRVTVVRPNLALAERFPRR